MICSRAEILVYLRKAHVDLTDADDALLDLLHPLTESAIHNYLQNDLNYGQYVEYLPLGLPAQEQDYPLQQYQKQGDYFVFFGANVGTDALKLSHTPVALTGLRVWEDVGAYGGQSSTAFASATELTLGTDFFLDVKDNSNLSTTGLLWRVGAWPQEPRCIKVQYYGGLTAQQLVGRMGGALKLATLMQIGFEFNAAKQINATYGIAGPKISEKMGKYQYEMGEQIALYMSGIAGRDLLHRVKELLQPYRSYKYL